MKNLIALAAALVLSGCASSSVVVGTVRPPIDPEQVRLYVVPPANYENVALLQASSEASFALTQQQKSNKTISRMKQEAADLGANGVLLQSVGKEYAGSVGSGYAVGSGGTAWGLGSSAATYNQAGAGMAIYVFADAQTEPLAPAPPMAPATSAAPPMQAAQPQAQPDVKPTEASPATNGGMRWKPRGT